MLHSSMTFCATDTGSLTLYSSGQSVNYYCLGSWGNMQKFGDMTEFLKFVVLNWQTCLYIPTCDAEFWKIDEKARVSYNQIKGTEQINLRVSWLQNCGRQELREPDVGLSAVRGCIPFWSGKGQMQESGSHWFHRGLGYQLARQTGCTETLDL